MTSTFNNVELVLVRVPKNLGPPLKVYCYVIFSWLWIGLVRQCYNESFFCTHERYIIYGEHLSFKRTALVFAIEYSLNSFTFN